MEDKEKIIRLFIGIEFPEKMKHEIDAFLRPLRQSPKGWESPHDYHQTLLFIGATPLSRLIEIQNRLDQICFRPFTLETSDFKFFNRRIMYLDFRPSLELIKLVTEIHKIFPEWVREDEKEFLPHVTVKRWQRYEYDRLRDGLAKRELKAIKFKVSAVALFKSEKDSSMNKYHVIHRTPCK